MRTTAIPLGRYYDGVGTAVNRTRSIQRWQHAASRFGNFDAIFMLGLIYLDGDELRFAAFATFARSLRL